AAEAHESGSFAQAQQPLTAVQRFWIVDSGFAIHLALPHRDLSSAKSVRHTVIRGYTPFCRITAFASLPFPTSVAANDELQVAFLNLKSSQVAAPILLGDVVCGSGGDGHDGQRRLVAALSDEGGAVGHEHILHVVDLVEAIQHALLRVVAHTRCP